MMIKTFLLIVLQLMTVHLFAQSIHEKAIDDLFSIYNSQTPGVSVLIEKDNKVIYKKSFGQSNLECGALNTSNSIFNATSIAKQFIAFGIYILDSKQLLSLEDKIQLHLKNIAIYDAPVTINHLLTHTSGIRDQRGLLTLAGYQIEDFISNEAILHLIENQTQLNFNPGTQFEYNHSNYTLLAKIIESASGVSLNEFLEEHIFEPLSMSKTFFLQDLRQVNKSKTCSYEFVDSTFTKVGLNYYNYGPTNLMSNIEDLSKWTKAFTNHNYIYHKLFAAFNDFGKLNNREEIIAMDLGDDRIMACKGQFYRTYKEHPFYSHGGSLGGYRSFLGRFPSDNVSIIILGNDARLNTYSTALKIADVVLNLPPEINKDEVTSNALVVNESKTLEPEYYAGNFYNSELNTTFKFYVSNGQLNLLVGNNQVEDLTFESSYKVNAKLDNDLLIEFIHNNDLKITSIKVKTTGVNEIVYYKVE